MRFTVPPYHSFAICYNQKTVFGTFRKYDKIKVQLAMKKSLLSALCAGALMLSVTSCASTEMMDFSGTIPAGVSAAEVNQAIKDAAAKRDWILKDLGNRTYEASYIARGHSVKVQLTYDKDRYNITYLNSTNMEYNGTEGTIHRNYNRWVNNLKHDIDLGLMQAEAR